MDKFRDYLLENHLNDLQLILEAADESKHYSIHVSFASLFGADVEIAGNILHHPRHYLPLCDAAIVQAQEKIATAEQTVKNRVHTRITTLPPTVNQGRIGVLAVVAGITVRTSQPTVLKLTKRYNCKKCKHVTVVQLEWERQLFREVKNCAACESKGVKAGTTLQQEECADYQEIKIEEESRINANVSHPMGMKIILLDDLVDKCRPGDCAVVCGVIIRRWGPLVVGQRTEITTVMIANSVSVQRKLNEAQFSTQDTKDMFENYWAAHNEKPLVGRDIILASICPQLYGMYTVKLALAVVLAGGVPKTQESGTRVRGDPHLLMIGDPGTGKSQLLHTASRLAIRSVLTTGIGATAAGLTAAAVKDGDGWHLEGGALVLADGGVCCIDEFATMRVHDRAAVHEAMEQQTISVAKAGLVSTLNSCCTVIAAVNPNGGRCVQGEEVKTSLGNPLLSRFDLILILKDNMNPEWDKMLSDHILKGAQVLLPQNSEISVHERIDVLNTERLWKEENLREYLAFVHTLTPTLSENAMKVLSATYQYHRSNLERRTERTTVRLLDSLVRLAEGHARLMYRKRVEVMDAVIAAQLVGTGDSSETDIGCPFPSDPMAVYYKEGMDILNEIGLGDLSASL